MSNKEQPTNIEITKSDELWTNQSLRSIGAATIPTECKFTVSYAEIQPSEMETFKFLTLIWVCLWGGGGNFTPPPPPIVGFPLITQ